jgi:hypothetical protein
MRPDEILTKVKNAIDALIEIGSQYDGLFPSLIDRDTHQMLYSMPPPIQGQRNGDRSHLGCNLIHDEAALKTMFALSEFSGDERYANAADRYLQRFSNHCTDTDTGLFPWGEHSFWHLMENRVGNSYVYHSPETKASATHDHLRQAPLWLWEKLWHFNPRCAERFAEGQDYHWVDCSPPEYIRHAPIETKTHPSKGNRSCDFPRHSGFYIFNLSFALAKTGRDDLLTRIEKFLDYWWKKRDDRGLLLIESRSPEDDERFYDVNNPGQTLSLATSLLESAEILGSTRPEISATMRERAATYLNGFFSAPHDLEKGTFVISSNRETNEAVQTMPVWGSIYGLWPASYVAVVALCAHRLTHDPRLLAWAESVGQAYLREPFPADVAVPAMDAGLALGLFADLYDLTGQEIWLRGGLELAGTIVELYFDKVLPRGAAGIEWYESQMGPSFLLHGLARMAMLAEDPESCPLPADYTGR